MYGWQSLKENFKPIRSGTILNARVVLTLSNEAIDVVSTQLVVAVGKTNDNFNEFEADAQYFTVDRVLSKAEVHVEGPTGWNGHMSGVDSDNSLISYNIQDFKTHDFKGRPLPSICAYLLGSRVGNAAKDTGSGLVSSRTVDDEKIHFLQGIFWGIESTCIVFRNITNYIDLVAMANEELQMSRGFEVCHDAVIPNAVVHYFGTPMKLTTGDNVENLDQITYTNLPKGLSLSRDLRLFDSN